MDTDLSTQNTWEVRIGAKKTPHFGILMDVEGFDNKST
jgi:hypothetical protein